MDASTSSQLWLPLVFGPDYNGGRNPVIKIESQNGRPGTLRRLVVLEEWGEPQTLRMAEIGFSDGGTFHGVFPSSAATYRVAMQPNCCTVEVETGQRRWRLVIRREVENDRLTVRPEGPWEMILNG